MVAKNINAQHSVFTVQATIVGTAAGSFCYPQTCPKRSATNLDAVYIGWAFARSAMAPLRARAGDEESIRDLLDEFDLSSGVVVMEAKTASLTTARQWRELVSDHWQLDNLEEEYRQIIGLFRPLKKALDKGKLPTPLEAFQARLLLIHEYRRILLRDTPLPSDLLPNRWQGTVARQLAQALYRDLAKPSSTYIQNELVNRQGRLPESEHYFYQRFGGISKDL